MRRLSEVDPEGGFRSDDEGQVFKDRPELAVLFSRVIASWSAVQGLIGLAAVSLLHGRSDVAAAMFSALLEDAQQYNALYAAADEALSKEDAELFKRSLRAVRKLGAGRHLLAHSVLGHSDAAKDCLLVIEQRTFSKISRIFFTAPSSGQERSAQVREIVRRLAAEIYVVDQADMTQMLSDIARASSLAMDASVLAAPVHPDKAGARARLEDLLRKK